MPDPLLGPMQHDLPMDGFANFATALRDDVPGPYDQRRRGSQWMGTGGDEQAGGGDSEEEELGVWGVASGKGAGGRKNGKKRKEAGGNGNTGGCLLQFGGGGAMAGRNRAVGGQGGGGGRPYARTRTVQSVLGEGEERTMQRTRVAMWWCEACDANTFLQRRTCFRCRRARTGDAIVVEEFWKVEMLPMDVRHALERGEQGRQGVRGGCAMGGGEAGLGGLGGWEDGAGGKGGKTMWGERNEVAAEEKGVAGKGKGKEHARLAGRIATGCMGDHVGGEGKGGRGPMGAEEVPGAESAAAAGGGAAEMEVDEQRGKAANNGTRPKAKARAELPGKRKESEQAANVGGAVVGGASVEGGGAQEPQPYVHPSEPRIVLAGRMEALQKRKDELRQKAQGSDDVLVQRAKKKLEETEKMVKAAGGKTQSKLVFSVMDARKDVGEAEKALGKAEEELAAASEQVSKWLQAQDRAETLVRARATELANCKSRVAHLGFQFAAEAACDVSGYSELSSAMHLVWAGVEGAGMQGVLPALQQMVTFIEKFRPVEYAAEDDSELRELASGQADSSSATSVATLVVGEAREHGAEGMQGPLQEVDAAAGAVPVQTMPPAAFRSAEQARTAVQLALADGAKPPVATAWQAGRGRELAREKDSDLRGGGSGARKQRSASRSRGRTEAEAGEEGKQEPMEKVARKTEATQLDVFMGTGVLGDEAARENCLACNAIVRPQELCGRCECGGPVCKECDGSNECLRCHGK